MSHAQIDISGFMLHSRHLELTQWGSEEEPCSPLRTTTVALRSRLQPV